MTQRNVKINVYTSFNKTYRRDHLFWRTLSLSNKGQVLCCLKELQCSLEWRRRRDQKGGQKRSGPGGLVQGLCPSDTCRPRHKKKKNLTNSRNECYIHLHYWRCGWVVMEILCYGGLCGWGSGFRCRANDWDFMTVFWKAVCANKM